MLTSWKCVIADDIDDFSELITQLVFSFHGLKQAELW